MSAESSLVFYGLRFDVDRSDVEALELRKHPWIAKARSAGLHHYWGNFGGLNPRFYFFVGRKMGITGVENSTEVVVDDFDLSAVVAETKPKLREAGFEGDPKLFVQLMPS